MKKKLRIFGLLMAVMMFICCLPLDVFADSFIVAGEEFDYYLNENGTYTVEGFDGDVEVLEIPAYIDGIAVTEIASWFGVWSDIPVKKIVIPETVYKIDGAALGHWEYEYIEVDDDSPFFCDIDGVIYDKDVKRLVRFPKAKADEEYTVPDSVTVIGMHAFYDTNLEKVVLPDNLERIEYDAFYWCDELVNINLPDTVTYIGDNAFAYCELLTDIKLPKSLTYIGDSAFEECDSITEIVIPDSVTTVDGEAFSWCDELKKVYIGSGVTNWGGCEDFSVNSEDMVWYEDVFYVSYALEEITVSSDNKLLSSQNGVLFNKDKTVLLKYPTGSMNSSYTIPGSVKIIGEDAFRCSDNLKNVTIPYGVTHIKYKAFSYCCNLLNVTIPDSVTYISSYAFSGCDSFTDITIPDSVTYLGDQFLGQCDNLKTVYIGSGVEVLDSDPFDDCYSLTNIKVSSENLNYSSMNGVLFDKDKTKLIKYPAGLSLEDYVIPSTVKEVKESAFDDCPDFYSDAYYATGELYLGDALLRYEESYSNKGGNISVKTGTRIIGGYAFEFNEEIWGISLPESMRAISSRGFECCHWLQAIYIPAGVKYIGDYVFSHCDMLTEIYYGGTQEQWSKIENIENLELNQNTTIHFESEGNEYVNPVLPEDDYLHTYEDTESGISVSTDTNATLSAENVMTQEIVDSVAELLPKAKVESVYEINLRNEEDEEIQPVDKVLVKIPTKNRFARVYRMEEDGTLTDMNARYESGYLWFYTDHFSYYALGMKQAEHYELGDVDMDERINVKDATAVQKHLAEVTEYQQDVIDLLMDYDQNDTINVKDATAIQKKVAGLV